MTKWVKQKYTIKKKDGAEEVEGSVCGQWGIDKRDRYYLTHLPTGYLVDSARTMKYLKTLAESPEFQCYNGSSDVSRLAEAMKKLRNELGWAA